MTRMDADLKRLRFSLICVHPRHLRMSPSGTYRRKTALRIAATSAGALASRIVNV